MPLAEVQPRRSPSPTAILAVVAFGVFVAADDLTVVSTMLRQIIGDLGITLPDGFGDAAWIVNSYLVAYVAVMPVMGRLSDVLGRRKVFVGSLVVFLAGSLVVPFAGSLGWFIAGRVMTAVGGGAMVPVALAVVADVYEERRRATALGILGAVDTMGWVWGPLFGAMLVRFLDWRWQFYLNVPLAAAGIAASWWALRDLDRPTAGRRIDLPGAVSLSVALVALNIALVNTSEISGAADLAELADLGAGRSSPVLPFAVAGVLALAAFVYLDLTRPDPLVHLRLLGRGRVGPALAVNLLVGTVLIIAMVDVPLFVNLAVETDLERAAVLSGWVMSALTATMAVFAWLGGRATGRWSYRPVSVAGLLAIGGGFLAMGLTWGPETGPRAMAPLLGIFGLGFGLVIAPTNAAAIDGAPPDRRGVAGGMVIMARLVGLAVGLSGLTAWAMHRFNELRAGLVLPPQTDPGYAAALESGQAELTARALTETFLFSAALAGLALVVALWLRGRSHDAPPDRLHPGGDPPESGA